MNAFLVPVRIAIVGSRGFAQLELVSAYVARLHGGCTVLSGGAPGVDTVAVQAARERGLSVQVFHAAWRTHGRRAGILRNRLIVEACEVLVAFWDGHSPGTRNGLELARTLGRPAEIILASPPAAPVLALELRR